MTSQAGTSSSKPRKARFVATCGVAVLMAAAISPAIATPALAVDATDTAAVYDINESVQLWGAAAAMLGTAGSLWEPANTAGLHRTSKVAVITYNLVITNGAVTSGDTFAGATYGRPAKGFQLSEKWAETGFAAEPATSTSLAKVGKLKIKLGEPGTQTTVTAQVYANCFKQPTNANPKEVPAGYRCKKSDVLASGGMLKMTARPPSTMTAPGDTSIVIQSTGLTYDQLVAIASSFVQVAPDPNVAAGSAQMRAVCKQIVTDKSTFSAADKLAQANGYTARLASVNGQPQALTMDFRFDRMNLSTVNNAVTECTYG
ncbi:MAG: hypothetical protein EXQ60_06135 [Candidatus Nanopelagicales bacterium]|nr:hypothetical protein [Candidatus Nanopelagicales bacterium]